jgi:hypothetical protein
LGPLLQVGDIFHNDWVRFSSESCHLLIVEFGLVGQKKSHFGMITFCNCVHIQVGSDLMWYVGQPIM